MSDNISFSINSDGLSVALKKINETLTSVQKINIEHKTALIGLNTRVLEISSLLKDLQDRDIARKSGIDVEQIQETKSSAHGTNDGSQVSNQEGDESLSSTKSEGEVFAESLDWGMAEARAPVTKTSGGANKPLAGAKSVDSIKSGNGVLSPDARIFTPIRHEQHPNKSIAGQPKAVVQPPTPTRPKEDDMIKDLRMVSKLVNHVGVFKTTLAAELREADLGPAVESGLKDTIHQVLGCDTEDLSFVLSDFQVANDRYCAARLMLDSERLYIALSYAIPWTSDRVEKPELIRLFAMRNNMEKFARFMANEPELLRKAVSMGNVGGINNNGHDGGRLSIVGSGQSDARSGSAASTDTIRNAFLKTGSETSCYARPASVYSPDNDQPKAPTRCKRCGSYNHETEQCAMQSFPGPHANRAESIAHLRGAVVSAGLLDAMPRHSLRDSPSSDQLNRPSQATPSWARVP